MEFKKLLEKWRRAGGLTAWVKLQELGGGQENFRNGEVGVGNGILCCSVGNAAAGWFWACCGKVGYHC